MPDIPESGPVEMEASKSGQIVPLDFVAVAPLPTVDTSTIPIEPAPCAPIHQSSSLPFWYPHWRGKPLYHGNEEGLAWAFDGTGRAVPFIYAGAFFGTAILYLAREAAGCATEIPDGQTKLPDCNKTVYGIRPSSYLTTYTMIIGVSSTFLLPLMGAIIDHTRHRLLVGRIATACFLFCTFPQIFLSLHNWFIMAVFQIMASICGWAQTAISYAYLPELTSDEIVLADYTKSFTMAFFSAMALYLAITIGVVTVIGYGHDSVMTSRVGAVIALIVAIPLLTTAWGRLFKHRNALQELHSHQSVWTAGFIQLYHTIVKIFKHHRALKWFYLSIAASDAGIQALATIAVTYLTEKLGFTATQNGIAILLMLLGSVPGAIASNVTIRKLDPRQSSILALLYLIIITSIFAATVRGPGQQMETYLLCFFWGLGVSVAQPAASRARYKIAVPKKAPA